MFKMERKSNGNKTDTETSNNQTPLHSLPHDALPHDATPHIQTSAQTPSTLRAVSESEALAREIKEGTLNGYVGNGTTLKGEATFKGMLRVDGFISGKVSSEDGTLILSTNGQVDAAIEVAVAMINGTVNGDITATKRVELGRTSKVIGSIETPALVIERDAVFEGSCRMPQVRKAYDKQDEEEGTASAPVEPNIIEQEESPTLQSAVTV
jgi:cytoskeletal protein CcmA (bactofilin family)